MDFMDFISILCRLKKKKDQTFLQFVKSQLANDIRFSNYSSQKKNIIYYIILGYSNSEISRKGNISESELSIHAIRSQYELRIIEFAQQFGLKKELME